MDPLTEYILLQERDAYTQIKSMFCKSDKHGDFGMDVLIEKWLHYKYQDVVKRNNKCDSLYKIHQRKPNDRDAFLKWDECAKSQGADIAKEMMKIIKSEGENVVKKIYADVLKQCNKKLDMRQGLKILTKEYKQYKKQSKI